jgi:hypothetical protein
MINNVIIDVTRAGNEIFKAKIGLVPETYWQSDLSNCPTHLLCTIRKLLEEAVPGLTEKFNPTTPSLRYFGYRVKKSKDINDISKKAYSEDKAYIYVKPERLEIDLKINPKFINDIRQDGFEVRPKTNYQARTDWVTGWQVPHLTNNVEAVMKWLSKAFAGVTGI